MVMETPVVVNNLAIINRAINDLFQYYSIGDYRAGYIRTFGMVLSTLIPGDLLEKNEKYMDTKRSFPLPTSNRGFVTEETFSAYYTTFEQIMRDVGLVGLSKSDVKKPEDVPQGYDLFSDFMVGSK